MTFDLEAAPGIFQLSSSALGVMVDYLEPVYLVNQAGAFLVNQDGDYLIVFIARSAGVDVVDLGA